MRILENIRPEEKPSCLKALLWARALDAAIFAENLSSRQFPAQQVLDYLEGLLNAIEYLRDETLDAIQENPNLLLNKADFSPEDPDLLEDFLQGVRRFYWSRHEREVFNEEVYDDSPRSGGNSRAVFLWVHARFRDMTK